MVQSETLSVSHRTRTMARRLVAGRDLVFPVPASYQDLTIAFLPPRVREQFGFYFGDAKRREIDRAVALTRRLYPLLPLRFRYVGPYQEAQQRLRGGLTADFVTRLFNRLWIGRAELE
jgi:uncharacterized protein (DUF2236 family)